MSEYYLLAVLDDSAQERLAKLSDNLTEQGFAYTRYTPYHITLWSGEKPSPELMAHFSDICAKTPPIETALASIGLFGLAVLFLAPLPSNSLINLEKSVCKEIDSNSVGWVPHTTIRMGDDSYIASATPVLAGSFEPFAVRIERLELYEFGDDFARLDCCFPLCGKKRNGEDAFVQLADSDRSRVAWPLSDEQYVVVKKAISDEWGQRQQSIKQLQAEWEAAR